MARLTQENKKQIEKLILDHKFGKQFAELDMQALELGLVLYALRYNEEKQRKMKALPDGWLPTVSHFEVRTIARGFLSFKLDKEYPIPFEDYRSTITYDTRTKENDLIEDFCLEREKVSDARRELRTKIYAVLNSVNTVKQAVDTWPEAEKFIQEACGVKLKSQVPAVIIADLNNQLDLPPDSP